MINCRNCGVELDEHMNFCPLCGAPVFDRDREKREKLISEKLAASTKLRKEIDQLDKAQRRKFFWEAASIIIGSGALSALTLNFIIQASLSWSLYVLVGALTVFGYVSTLSFVRSGSRIMFILFFINGLSLLLIDLINGEAAWSVQLAIPLLIALVVILAGVILAIRQTPEKGFNIIAYIFLALAVLSLAVDSLVSIYVEDRLNLSWSVIVLGSILPVAFIMLYIHYKLRRGTDLRKFFHI